jgi:hypothetical protein
VASMRRAQRALRHPLAAQRSLVVWWSLAARWWVALWWWAVSSLEVM